MQTNLILTDVDEVVLQWTPAFSDWVISTGRFKTKGPLIQSYNIEDWIGRDLATTRALIAEFNKIHEQFGFLKPYADALEYIPRLKSEGFDFVAITACAEDSWTHDTRRANLETYFPGIFDTIHCVGLGASKHKFLERYKPTFWVEDKMKHAINGRELGHRSFIISRPHNMGQIASGVCRVPGWEKIYQMIHCPDCECEVDYTDSMP